MLLITSQYFGWVHITCPATDPGKGTEFAGTAFAVARMARVNFIFQWFMPFDVVFERTPVFISNWSSQIAGTTTIYSSDDIWKRVLENDSFGLKFIKYSTEFQIKWIFNGLTFSDFSTTTIGIDYMVNVIRRSASWNGIKTQSTYRYVPRILMHIQCYGEMTCSFCHLFPVVVGQKPAFQRSEARP